MHIRVVRPFVLSHRDGREVQFGVGTHDIGDDVASHPYIKAFADGHIEDEDGAREKAEAAQAEGMKAATVEGAKTRAAAAAADRPAK